MEEWRSKLSEIVSSCRDVIGRYLTILKPDPGALEGFRDRLSQIKSSFSKLYESFVEGKKSKEENMADLHIMDSFEGILFNLEGVLHSLRSIVDDRVVFSDKAVGEVDELRADLSNLLKDLEDLIATYNKTLAKALREEAKEVSKKADSFSFYHEERIVAGICTPKASPVYLNLLSSTKGISYGVFRIAKNIEEREA